MKKVKNKQILSITTLYIYIYNGLQVILYKKIKNYLQDQVRHRMANVFATILQVIS